MPPTPIKAAAMFIGIIAINLLIVGVGLPFLLFQKLRHFSRPISSKRPTLPAAGGRTGLPTEANRGCLNGGTVFVSFCIPPAQVWRHSTPRWIDTFTD